MKKKVNPENKRFFIKEHESYPDNHVYVLYDNGYWVCKLEMPKSSAQWFADACNNQNDADKLLGYHKV